MEDVRQWLSSPRNYEQGLALYKNYGTSNALKLVLAIGSTPYNRTKLAELLQNLLPPALPKPVIATPVQTKAAATTTPKPEITGPDQQLEQDWKGLYKDAAFLHGQLHTAKTDAERKDLAAAILDNFDAIGKIDNQQEYVKEHGKLPPSGATPKPVADLTAIEISNELLNLRSKISKQKNNPKRAAEVATWLERKKQLEEALSHARTR